MINQHQIATLRALRGAPLSVLFALGMARRPVGLPFLIDATGYKKNVVSEALRLLAQMQYAFQATRYNGWQLAPGARQFVLFSDAEIEGDLITLPACSSSSLINPVNDIDTTTTTTTGEGDLITLPHKTTEARRALCTSPEPIPALLPPAAQDIVNSLTLAGSARKNADASVRAALEARDDPAALAALVEECFVYAGAHPYDPATRDGIKMPGAWAASRIRNWDGAPAEQRNGSGGHVDDPPTDLEARRRNYVPEGYEDLINP